MKQLRVICTDRDAHVAFAMTTVTMYERDEAPGQLGMRPTKWAATPHDGTRGEDGELHGLNVWQFRCAKCGRHPQLRPERFEALVDRALKLGMSELDMSKLPL